MTDAKSLNEWRDAIHQYAVEKGWCTETEHPVYTNFAECIALIHTELSEAYEHYRKGYLVDHVYRDLEKPDGIPTELVDVMIRVLHIFGCMHLDVDLLMVAKHEYNKTRPYRHGGKVS